MANMRISQIVLCAVLLGKSGHTTNAFSGGQFKRPTIVPKGEPNDEPSNASNAKKNEALQQPKLSEDPPPVRTTTSSSSSSSPASSSQPIVSGDRANSDRYQNSMSPWSSGAPSSISATIGGGQAPQSAQPPGKSKPRMSRAASAIPIISSGNGNGNNGSGIGKGDSSNKPASFNTSGVSRGAVASMTSSAPPAGGTTVSHAAASTSGTSVGSVGSMTSSQPPTGGTTVTHAVVSGDRACSDRYQNSMMNSDQGNRSATYKPKPRISRAARTIPVVGGGSSGGGGGGGRNNVGSPTSNTSGVSRGSIASMTTSAPVGKASGGSRSSSSSSRRTVAATPAADKTPVVSGDRACADRYQNSIASAVDPNRSSTYRGPAKVTRAATTIPKMPDGSSAGGSPWVPKAGPGEDAAAAAAAAATAARKKMKPNAPSRGAVDESLKPIISGQVGANVNDRYGNSMTQD